LHKIRDGEELLNAFKNVELKREILNFEIRNVLELVRIFVTDLPREIRNSIRGCCAQLNQRLRKVFAYDSSYKKTFKRGPSVEI